MSVRTMARVWDYSEQTGSRLLLLLALADFSDDEGYCWPKLDALAEKARLKRRTAQYAIEALVSAGELLRTDGRGRGNGATYRVVTGLNGANLASISERQKMQSEARKGAIRDSEKVQTTAQKGANYDTHIENHQEPSLGTAKEPPPNPPALQAGQPDDQGVGRAVPARVTGKARKAASPRPRDPAFDAFMGAFPTAAASLAAKFSRLVKGKAAPGDWDAWLREVSGDRAKGYVKAHHATELFLAWIDARRSPAVADTGLDARMRAAGAPGNWREIVYAPGGVRRAPALALPLLGLEPYAPVEAWPAWYRAIEGQGVAA